MNISQILVSAGTFFLLVGYEGIRSPSNTLFQQAFGVAKFPLALAVVPLFLLPIHALYSWALNYYGNRLTLLLSNLFSYFILALLHYFAVKQNPVAIAGLLIFREVYIVLILEQLWSYVNSTTTLQESKSVHSVFSGLGNLGGAIGGFLVSHLAIAYGTLQVLWMTHLGLIFCLGFLWFGIKELSPTLSETSSDTSVQNLVSAAFRAKKNKTRFGFSAFKKFPILFSILSLVLLSQFCITTSNLALQSFYREIKLPPDQQTSFSGSIYSWISFGSLALQFLVAPFLLKFFSPNRIQILIPLLAFVFHLAGFYSGSLLPIALAFASLKAVDYSLFRISKEILFIPLDFEARHPAKQLIDTIGYRSAKALMSLLLAGLVWIGYENSKFFLGLTITSVLLWLYLAIHINRTQQRVAPQT